jgi:hypothetical protein
VLVLPPTSKPVHPEPARGSDARRLHVGTTSVRRPSATSSRRDTMGPDDFPPAALLSDSLRTRTPTSAA